MGSIIILDHYILVIELHFENVIKNGFILMIKMFTKNKKIILFIKQMHISYFISKLQKCKII